jgi:uncharacterized protein (TIGR02145 family)
MVNKKKIISFISAVVLSASLWAQAPNKMSFQTVVRNNLGKLVVNKSIGVRLSILKTSSTGTAVYVESHTKTSNVNGLLTLEVGTGAVTSGAFATIDWSQGPYFLKTEMDVNGGANYTITGVTEFVSVPYAKLSDKANSVKTVANGANVGDMNFWNGTTWVPLNKGIQGQTLTFCDGKPTWTIGGVCPGTITALNCPSATNNGTLTATTAASGVTSVISYTGGNGGVHNGQVVTSTGVTGLTATLQAGTFANGNGGLTYIITGTPATSGTASFALNIGGKTCALTRTVAIAQTSGINFTSIGAPVGSFQNNVSDIDGNTYKTVQIGTQVWMAENLKVSKFNDGSTIPNVTDDSIWEYNKTLASAHYNNDVANNAKYGKLYNWFAVSKTTNNNKNICPTGWHVPTDAEWTVLIDYLGGADVAGGKMKEVGTTNWGSPNTDATNISLFTGLPGGNRSGGGSFYLAGELGVWWSATQYDSSSARYRYLMIYSGLVDSSFDSKKKGFSVRCVRD